VDPMDISLLVFAWHCDARTMCEFTQEEFTRGLLALGVDSVEKLKGKLPYMRSELRDDHKFRVRTGFLLLPPLWRATAPRGLALCLRVLRALSLALLSVSGVLPPTPPPRPPAPRGRAL
jgi:hypothetical protein